MTDHTETAILAGGCFWGAQELLRKRDGVISTRVGYTGGDVPNATYQNHEGHAEAVEIVFDPERISYRDILEFFFQIHDPTTKDRQGNDMGRQYRSAVFYADDEQKRIAEAYIRQLNEARVFNDPIITTLEPFQAFYVAEEYHQDYAARNPYQPYIAYIAQPKVEKLRENFADRLKNLFACAP